MPYFVVYGEDPNCDMAGPHHEPVLGYFEGNRKDVEEYAKSLPNWSAWGRGGHVDELHFQQVNPQANKRRLELLAKKNSLEFELQEINKELKS